MEDFISCTNVQADQGLCCLQIAYVLYVLFYVC